MDTQVTLRMLDDMEKLALERHSSLMQTITGIKEQQLLGQQDRKEIHENIQIMIEEFNKEYQHCPYSLQVTAIWKAIEETKKELSDKKKADDDLFLSTKFYHKNPTIYWQNVAIKTLLFFATILGAVSGIIYFRQNKNIDEVQQMKSEQKVEAKKTDALLTREIDSINGKKTKPIRLTRVLKVLKPGDTIKTVEIAAPIIAIPPIVVIAPKDTTKKDSIKKEVTK